MGHGKTLVDYNLCVFVLNLFVGLFIYVHDKISFHVEHSMFQVTKEDPTKNLNSARYCLVLNSILFDRFGVFCII